MTGRDLNAWLGTGDGKEPAPKAPPRSLPVTAHEIREGVQRHAPLVTDAVWALAFMQLIAQRRRGGNGPCA